MPTSGHSKGTQDRQKIEALIAAAHANYGEAQYDLGLAYFNGDGVPQDYLEAYFWLTVCSQTKGVFWSPSPDEVAAEASVLVEDKSTLGDAFDRIVRWHAEHEPPMAGDY